MHRSQSSTRPEMERYVFEVLGPRFGHHHDPVPVPFFPLARAVDARNAKTVVWIRHAEVGLTWKGLYSCSSLCGTVRSRGLVPCR